MQDYVYVALNRDKCILVLVYAIPSVAKKGPQLLKAQKLISGILDSVAVVEKLFYT